MSYKLRINRTPNRSARVGKPKYLVTHHTIGSFEGSERWLDNPESEASADEVLRKDGSEVVVMNPMADRQKTWEVGNANNLCYGFELEAANTSVIFPPRLYETLAARIKNAAKAAKNVYGVTIPLRKSRFKGDPGIASHKQIALWYGGSDHTDGEIEWDKLMHALRPAPLRVFIEVWAGGKRRYYARTGDGRVKSMLTNRAAAIGGLAVKFGTVTIKKVRRR